MGTQNIRNYRKVDEQTATAGQPKAQHLEAAAAEGFKTVINLATLDPRYSLEDEAGLVRSLGMSYHHLPVEWDNPTREDFAAFEALMKSIPQGKTLIHCAANFRVTAFYALYALKHLGWPEARADEFRASVWQGSHYPVWEAFIAELKAEILAAKADWSG